MAAKKNDDLLKLKKQLKDGALSPLYVFYGEEARYVRKARRRTCAGRGIS